MWPITPKKTNFVAITISSQDVACSLIKSSTSLLAPYELVAYQRFSFEQPIKDNLSNPSGIKKHIEKFLVMHNAQNSVCALGLSTLDEDFVSSTHLDPTYRDLALPAFRKLVGDFYYLYSREDGTSTFYMCGMSQKMLLQYKLLLLSMPVHSTMITSTTGVLINLYQHVHGKAFRSSQFGRDMERVDNRVQNLFSLDMLRRCLIMKTITHAQITQELPTLCAHVGLFLARRECEAY